MTVPEILRAAAARVRQGWCQGLMSDYNGGVCAVGAIHEVAEFQSLQLHKAITLNFQAREAVIQALKLPPTGEFCVFSKTMPTCPIPVWNDAPDQTAENVALGLEYSALHYELTHLQPAAALPAPDQELVTC